MAKAAKAERERSTLDDGDAKALKERAEQAAARKKSSGGGGTPAGKDGAAPKKGRGPGSKGGSGGGFHDDDDDDEHSDEDLGSEPRRPGRRQFGKGSPVLKMYQG